jgi:ATP-binding protein involved in chromosome partitioning
MSVAEEDVLNALRKVEDPDLHRDLVSLGLVKNVRVAANDVSVTVELTTPACPLQGKIKSDVEQAIRGIPGVANVRVEMTANVRSTVSAGTKVSGIKNTVSIASGKGGVGKSTVAVNLAVALAESGACVGLMDADVYGPSIPMMMGLAGKPRVEDNKLVPMAAFGVKVISMGFLIPDDQPVIWRGPMLHGAIQQFLAEVAWGELDYLLVDLPPGTGDVQLSLSQNIPMTGSVFVTTPQDVSLLDVKRGIAMFQKVRVPILGMIENMSYFVCSGCNKRTEIFGYGGGKKAAERLGIPFFGELPIDTDLREGGDTGRPIVVDRPDSVVGKRFREIAGELARGVSITHFGGPAIKLS